MRFLSCSAILIGLIAANLAAQTDFFILPHNKGKAGPWKGIEKTEASASSFQFAVVADRTGGMQGGVFQQAVKKLNLLQPDFVISVGDLIDGYTRNADVVNNQWDEFDAIIGKLQMPFFYIPGNHDLTNEILADIWKKRRGESYYHFLYEHVLFLCLNTEDRDFYGISNDQVKYFENVLNTYRDVRWTFVFMHRPLWDYGDKAGYEHIESALQGRDYTLFSGHNHNYVKKNRNGQNHFVLATTGGGSELRGAEFGELYHVVWVTVGDTMPVIVNLALDGIYDENLVSEEDYPLVQTLRNGDWFEVKPFVSEHEKVIGQQTELVIRNPAEAAMHISGTLAMHTDLIFEPQLIELSVPGKSVKSISVSLRDTSGTFRLSAIDKVQLTLTAAYENSEGNVLQLPATKNLLMDWIHTCPARSAEIKVDGVFDEWPKPDWIEVKNPQDIAESWDWHGVEDGYFRFATAHDTRYLYLALEATDERIVAGSALMTDPQDRFTISLLRPETRSEHMTIQVAALPQDRLAVSCGENDKSVAIKSAGIFSGHTFSVELAIPHNTFGQQQKKFRMNVAYMDHDNPNNVKPSVLYWRPRWGSPGDYADSGTFVLK